MLLLCILMTISLNFVYSASITDEKCRNSSMTCINIKKCKSLLDLLMTKSDDPKVVSYLRASFCGYDQKTPKVCCSDLDIQSLNISKDSRQIVSSTPAPQSSTPNSSPITQCGRQIITQNKIVGGQDATLGENCKTPGNKPGTCISIKRCAFLLDLLINRHTDPRVVKYLRSSQCGYEGTTPKVCCLNEPAIERQDVSKINNFCSCGHSQMYADIDIRIAGGRTSVLGAWPWMAAVGYQDRDGIGPNWLCGGTLISDRYVVTAAHCLFVNDWKPYTVRLGELNLNETINDGASPVDIPIETAFAHDNYSRDYVDHDIALIKLKRSPEFNDFIRPICLPSVPEFQSRSLVNEDVFVAGWGRLAFRGERPQALQDLRIPIQDNNVCKVAYADKPGANINDKVICAGVLTGGMDACAGDSGGPLMYLRNSSFYLVGIVSYGYRCAEINHPGIYTRVSKYIDWINNKTHLSL